MPQLRNASTGALIAEHDDPIGLAAIARIVGLDDVLFDGVGMAFEVSAALNAYDARLAQKSGDESAVQRAVESASQEVAGRLNDSAVNPDVEPVVVGGIFPG